jgi:hypothetical protein
MPSLAFGRRHCLRFYPVGDHHSDVCPPLDKLELFMPGFIARQAQSSTIRF